jgi:hypothetical protein
MTYTTSVSSALSVLLVTAGAFGEVQKAPAKPNAAIAASATTPAQSATVISSGQKIAAAVAALPKEKRQDATTVMATANAVLGADKDTDSLLLVMLEYQRLVNKEAADDAKRVREVMPRLQGLKLDNAAIDAGMSEARDKATNAMEAAHLGMVMGVIAGMVQVGAASSGAGVGAAASAVSQGSDVALGAVAERAIAATLPATARAAVDRQLEPLLARATKAWDEKTSVAGALGSVLTTESALTPLDRDELIAFVLCRLHRRALDDLEAAIKAKRAGAASLKVPYLVAVKRIRITLAGLTLLAKPLSKKDT